MTAPAGIVRRARRPPGWRPPGPAPTGAARPDLLPRPGEDLCHLAGDWRILQRTDGHRWSLDDLVTAWFAVQEARGRPPAAVADLGCGIGAVLMLLAWRFPSARCVGIEAQAVSVGLARRSLAWNGVTERCRVVRGDLRDPTLFPAGATFDLVTATPPYLRPGTGVASRRVQAGPCRFERRGGIEAYAEAAARILAPAGRFVTCAGGGQAERVARAGAAAGLAVVARRDVVPREGKSVLFTVWSMRCAAEGGAAAVHPPLVVRDRSGRRTATFGAVRAAMGMPP